MAKNQVNVERENVSPFTAACGMFADFTSNSTVHGVRYLGERKRHWIERVFWILAFIISIVVCKVFFSRMYNKWSLSPAISTFTEKKASVWEVPFPAITICSEAKALSEQLDFTKGYSTIVSIPLDEPYNLTTEELIKLEAIAQVCDPRLFAEHNISSGIKLDDIVPTLKRISPELNDIMMFCRWRNKKADCNDLFSEIITEEGFCYTFNMLDSTEIFREDVLDEKFVSLSHGKRSINWTLEGGYTTIEKDVYPERVLGYGARAGLNIEFKSQLNDTDYICRGPVQGFKIFLHTPGEIPQVSKNSYRLTLRQEAVISVKPNMVTTLEGLKEYSPEKRDCFFSNEKYLKFFKVYSQSNCELECLANFTLKACDCVKFSMPRDNKTSICSQEQVECYTKAKDDLMEVELLESLKYKFSGESSDSSHQSCNCLPDCNSVNYDAEITQDDYEFVEVFYAYGADLNEFPGLVLARLTIVIKETQFSTTTRSENYGWYEFIGNCGGLLGLFMGVSLLSVIEFVYYFTLRLACNLGCRGKFPKVSPTSNVVDKAPELNCQHIQTQTDNLDNNQFNGLHEVNAVKIIM